MSNDYFKILKLRTESLDREKKRKEKDSGNLNKQMVAQQGMINSRLNVEKSMPPSTSSTVMSGLGNSMLQALGNGPYTGWRAVAQGIATGLNASAATEESERKAKRLTGLIEWMDYSEKVYESAKKQNEANERLQNAEKTIMPQLSALTANMNKLSPRDFRNSADELVHLYNEKSGRDLRISMIDQHNGKVLVKDGDNNETIDLYDLFPDYREKAYLSALEQKALKYTEEEKMYKDDDLENKKRRTYATIQKNEIMGQLAQEKFARFVEDQNEKAIEKIGELDHKLGALQEVKSQVNRLKELAKQYPQVFQSAKGDAWSKEVSWKERFAREIAPWETATPEEKTAISEINKIKSSLVLHLVETMGLKNQTLDKLAEGAVPNRMLNAESIPAVGNMLIRQVDEQTHKINRQIKAIQRNRSKNEALSSYLNDIVGTYGNEHLDDDEETDKTSEEAN